MEEYIKKVVEENNYIYYPIPESSLETIYNLYSKGIVSESDLTGIEYFYYGRFYQIAKDYDKMIKYYTLSYEKGDKKAVLSLGNHFRKVKDYDNMKKYYFMSNNDPFAMHKLGNYYRKVEKEIEFMKFYYGLAIEQGHINSMIKLGYHYKKCKDFDNMLKYYKMAANLGDMDAINLLGSYFQKIEDYDNMKKYFEEGIKNKDIICMFNYANYFSDNENFELAEKYYLMAIKEGDTDSMINLGILYGKNNDPRSLKYLEMANNSDAFFNIAVFCRQKGDYEKMKKYYVLAIRQNDFNTSKSIEKLIDQFIEYYKNNENDYSFLNYLDIFGIDIWKLVKRFKEDYSTLPKEYYAKFCSIDFYFLNNAHNLLRYDILINKQYILKKTNIWPRNFQLKYLPHFMEILQILHTSALPKDIMLMIAGYLFL